jgi:hypothetical protein
LTVTLFFAWKFIHAGQADFIDLTKISSPADARQKFWYAHAIILTGK